MPVPQQADIFLIPLFDGQFGFGQVVVPSPDTPMGTALCLITNRKVARDAPCSPIALGETLSLLVVKDDLLKDGTWPIIGFETLPNTERIFALKAAKEKRFDGIAIHDPAIVEAFTNALHGLYPWDGFPDTQFFTNLLIHPDKKPSIARTKSQFDVAP